MGTPARMGPAFFPFWLGLILLVLGLVIACSGLRTMGTWRETRISRIHWAPILCVLGAVCSSASSSRPPAC
jgi:hypothetical protein